VVRQEWGQLVATAISFDTAKKSVVSLLQASQTAYGTSTTGNAPDGSNRQYSSSEEINAAILTADGEVCTLIANTLQSPFQTTFIQTSAALAAPSQPLPARNGMILRVQCQSGQATLSFLYSTVSVANNIVGLSVAHNLYTGQLVTLTTTGVLPPPLAISTNYYIINVTSTTFQFAATVWDAFNNNPIVMTGQGSGAGNAVVSSYIEGTQADSKDTVVQAWQNPQIFSVDPYGASGFWFIEGDVIYISSPNCKVVYTDYTLTSSPQAPEPYLHAVVAGAVAEILKDGGDDQLAAYYQAQYQGYLQAIAGGAMAIPAIAGYR
jgi:hypothetical protein